MDGIGGLDKAVERARANPVLGCGSKLREQRVCRWNSELEGSQATLEYVVGAAGEGNQLLVIQLSK